MRHRGNRSVAAGNPLRLGHFLAAICLVLRLAVPAGYMVAADSSNNEIWPLVLCTGQGAATQAGSAHQHHHGSHDHGAAGANHDLCPFATLLAAAPPVEPISLLPLRQVATLERDHAAAHQWQPGQAAPLPPAIGPPIAL